MPYLSPGAVLGTRTAWQDQIMSRPKIINSEDKLDRFIRVRVDSVTFERLKKMQDNSDCKGISQLARKILMGESITVFHRDVSMNGPMEELALIRKEIRLIGVNINQQTYHFHVAGSRAEKMFYVERTAQLYAEIDSKIDLLLNLVDKLAQKWLQRS